MLSPAMPPGGTADKTSQSDRMYLFDNSGDDCAISELELETNLNVE